MINDICEIAAGYAMTTATAKPLHRFPYPQERQLLLLSNTNTYNMFYSQGVSERLNT